ncbi:MAG TPA: Fur family transcriptional regulator [bacterium]|nr:Fur family transcriptional regulator [bacterium]HPJ72993.1 Fur family transcriptional regulator [bacterium]HPQ66819.1 Fur family transcriptional regulator [bacterium]
MKPAIDNEADALFREFLRRRGLRYTRERRAVLEAVMESRDHFAVHELHERIPRRGLAVGLATVYRLIPLLEEAGLIRRAASIQGSQIYERVSGAEPHYHLLCSGCGRLEEVASEPLTRCIDAVCRERAFLPSAGRLTIRGLCARCRKKKEGRA